MATFWYNKINNKLMENKPIWEADSHSPIMKTPCLSWHPRVYCSVYKNPPLDHDLSQINPIHTLPHSFFKIYSNIILQF
jgi:hypothetical protein